VTLAAGCDDGKSPPEPKPPRPQQSFMAIDREHQRLVAHYVPVSRALTAYELAYRDWRLGRLSTSALASRGETYRAIVILALAKVGRDPATGETARGKRLLVTALLARVRALNKPPGSVGYRSGWDRSLASARAGLTVLQDVRDRARLIPLPEDAIS
jgi:hypothetical protein